MARRQPTKPVNDLIKFWSEQEEKKKEQSITSPIARSPTHSKTLSPNASTPPSPRSDYFSQQQQNLHQLNTKLSPTTSPHNKNSHFNKDNKDDLDNIKSSSENPLSIVPLKSIPPVPPKGSYGLSTLEQNQALPLSPTKKVSNLVSRFEKVTPPPTSPTALSPTKRNFTTPEPISSPTRPSTSPLSSSFEFNLPESIFTSISSIPTESKTVLKLNGDNSNNNKNNNDGLPISIKSKDLQNPKYKSLPPLGKASSTSATNDPSLSSSNFDDVFNEITPFSSMKKRTSIIRKNIPENIFINKDLSSITESGSTNLPEHKPISPLKIDIYKNNKLSAPPLPYQSSFLLPTVNIFGNERDSWGIFSEVSSKYPMHSDQDLKTSDSNHKNQQHDNPDPYKSHSQESNNPFLDMTNNENPDIYKVVVGPKPTNKRHSIPTTQDTNAFIMEMQETNMAKSASVQNDDRTAKNGTFVKHISGTIELMQNLSRFLKSDKDEKTDEVTRSTLPTSQLPSSKPPKPPPKPYKKDDDIALTIAVRKSGSFQTINSSSGIRSVKRNTLKPVKIPKYPYGTRIPERNTLSPANSLKKKQAKDKSFLKYQNHNLPEYATNKSKMSVLVPHNLSSTEYGKINKSLPDLTVKHRHDKFNKVFRKNNMTVPDLTRLDTFSNDEKKPDFTMAIMTDAVLDPAKITKFSINPFDESESNQLFKPGAPWIHLPHLNEFIKSLPVTKFSSPKDLMTTEEYEKFIEKVKKGKKVDNSIFPPMNQIPENVTLDDLKNNAKKSNRFINQGLQNDIISNAIDGILTIEGFSLGSNIMRFEIVRDFIQFLALALSFTNSGVLSGWLRVILSIIPNLFGLNLSFVFGYGYAFFLVFCVLTFMGLYWFKLMTKYDPNADVEGLESSPWNLRPESKKRHNIAMIFLLTTLYLPVSKLSIDALVWADTFWVIPNPYLNSDDPVFEDVVGNGDSLRDLKDFCYVTSMNKKDLNFSPVIIGIALVTISFMTFWFPVALKRLVDKNVPKVDAYTETGETRKNKDEEFIKLMDKDTCPYNFIYNGYSERWTSYKSFIMANKFFSLFLISVISKDNCLFRTVARTNIETIRQSLQIVLMVLLLLVHWKSEPFIYRSQNTGEYWSRLSYVITTVLGLFNILHIGYLTTNYIIILVIDCIVTLIVVWYVVKQTNRFQNFMKIMKKQLDFSLNIYSPKLDFSKHIKRRIWQETWTTLLLTDEQFKMPEGKPVGFSESPYRPPYLLNFGGTVGERHAENLKIIRQIGMKKYVESMAPLPASLITMRSKIFNRFVGPDMYYSPEYMTTKNKTCFGKAYVVPFPFSVVMVYDEDENVVVLTQEWEIKRFMQQNESKEIQRRRLIRQKIRALEGKLIIGPCRDKSDVFSHGSVKNIQDMDFFGLPDVHYHRGLLSIQRNQRTKWQDHNMNPGFIVTITYASSNRWDADDVVKQPIKERIVGHDVIGITDDFQMTPQLEKLFNDNEDILETNLVSVQSVMKKYRKFYHDEAKWKEDTLSYGFFVNVYDNPSIPLEALPVLLVSTENNHLVQSIPESDYPSLVYLYERMRIVNLSRVHQWWYLFWEDLWRKNNKEIPHLSKNPRDFSPAYSVSICYKPMTRLELEEFLEKRGCWQNGGKKGFLHSGVLNRIYLYLNNVVFHGKSKKGGEPKKWSIMKGDTIDDNDSDYHLLHNRANKKSMRERILIMKDVMLRRKDNFPKTRPFFVLHEEESQSDSDGVNSGSDEETWW
nr:8510_t:CDS:2 [Entrophospora candida]